MLGRDEVFRYHKEEELMFDWGLSKWMNLSLSFGNFQNPRVNAHPLSEYYNTSPINIIITNKTMTDSSPPNSFSKSPEQTITLYFRLSGSKSVKVQLSPCTPLSQLKQMVSYQLGLPAQSQILFLGGRELREGRPFKLADRGIVHVKDRREMYEEMTILLLRHDPQKENRFKHHSTPTPVRVLQGELVRDFLHRVLGEDGQGVDLKRSRVIQCGRFLKGEKSFGEQKVVERAEVHVILRGSEMPPEEDQQHERFVKRVLKHSRNNSREETVPLQMGQEVGVAGQEEEGTLFKQKCDSAIFLQENSKHEPQCPHLTMTLQENSYIRRSLQPQSLQRTNPEFLQRRSSLLNHTKSSQRWVRAKVKPSELTPLKLGLKEYKKYDGPLSVRGCNCKWKRPFESRGKDSCKSHEESSSLSPLPSPMTKSQTKLKKSLTVIL